MSSLWPKTGVPTSWPHLVRTIYQASISLPAAPFLACLWIWAGKELLPGWALPAAAAACSYLPFCIMPVGSWQEGGLEYLEAVIFLAILKGSVGLEKLNRSSSSPQFSCSQLLLSQSYLISIRICKMWELTRTVQNSLLEVSTALGCSGTVIHGSVIHAEYHWLVQLQKALLGCAGFAASGQMNFNAHITLSNISMLSLCLSCAASLQSVSRVPGASRTAEYFFQINV